MARLPPPPNSRLTGGISCPYDDDDDISPRVIACH
jgi:hypothetical protein